MAYARLFLGAAIVALGPAWVPAAAQESPAQSTNAVANDDEAAKESTVKDLLRESSDLTTKGKLEEALREVDTALEIDPKNVLAYQLRATIYTQKKLWDRAAEDYATAYKLSPSATVYKYNIAEIQFMQKAYDNARPGFLALRDDPMLGDLSTYKVFLCDMLSGRSDVASKELDAMNQAATIGQATPGYYYSNAAWSLAHQNRPEANKYLISANHLFNSQINTIYLASLIEAGSAQGTVVSFVTKQGVRYDQVKAYIEGDGLRILTSNGWGTIPFDQLPDDLSVFPEEIQKEITERINLSPLAPNHIEWVTFTTKDGKHYDKVQVDVDDNGLSVLTSDGWLTVPFPQLPNDLSVFPEDIRQKIAKKRSLAPDDSLNPVTYSFVTKSGRHYDNVRVWVAETGINVLTPDGWLTVPFKDLPEDLSVFSPALEKEIEEKRQTAPDDSAALELISFTTKAGKHYDEVQVTVDGDGVSVLTPDGTFDVPFNQLPDDLSVFPDKILNKIKAMKAAAETQAKQAVAAAPASGLTPGLPADQSDTTTPGTIDPAQTNLHPDGASDSLFGSCVALEGSTLVVGGNGATYVYEDTQLKARLCPDADATHTGDPVNCVSLSDGTLALATRKGVYLYDRTDQGWELQAHLDLPDVTTVALDHNQLVTTTNGKGITSGTVAFYARQNGAWKSVPRDAKQNEIDYSADFFGHLVDVHGPWAVIGAPNWSSASYDNMGSLYSGRVYIAKFDGSMWREDSVLSPEDNGEGANQFGASVALSDDYLAISSANHDHIDYAPHHGIVHLFQKDVDLWKEVAPIKSPDPANDEGFGCAPIVFSGDTLAVGDSARRVFVPDVVASSGVKSGQPGEIKNAGAVYVYKDRMLQSTLLAPDPVDGINHRGSPDHYGCSIALSGDTIAVGARGQNSGTGAVYVWKRKNNQWQLAAELKGFHPQIDYHD